MFLCPEFLGEILVGVVNTDCLNLLCCRYSTCHCCGETIDPLPYEPAFGMRNLHLRESRSFLKL